MPFYNMLLDAWIYNQITAQQIQDAVTKGFITQAEADEILATPKAQ